MISRQRPEPASLLASPLVPMVVAPVLCLMLLWLGLPGFVLPWLALVARGSASRPPELTGPRKDGRPTVGSSREQRQLNAYTHHVDLRDACLSPTTLAPGWPVLGSWIVALVVGAGVWLLPQAWEATRWVNGALAAQLVAAIAHTGRIRDRDEPSPGTRVDTLPGLFAATPIRLVLHVIGGGLAGAGVVVAGLTVAALPWWAEARGRLLRFEVPGVGPLPLPATQLRYLVVLPQSPGWAYLLVGITLGILAAVAGPWRTHALTHWRQVVQARAAWAARWPVVKADPAPRLVDHAEHETAAGPVVVDTFICAAGFPAEKALASAAQLKPTLGDDQVRLALLPQPQTDPTSKQHLPGTSATLGFRAVQWPGAPVDITDPTVSAELVVLALESAMAWAADSTGWTRMLLLDATAVAGTDPGDTEAPGPDLDNTGDGDTTGVDATPAAPAGGSGTADAGQAWAVQWTSPIGMDLVQVRLHLAGPMARSLGCDVLVDHRATGGRLRTAGLMYAGALFPGPGVLDAARLPAPLPAGTADLADHLHNLSVEDWWLGVWGAVLGSEANPPTPKHNVRRTVTLPDGAEVVSQPFVVRQGQDPRGFFGTEAKLTSAMDSMGFVAVTGFPDGAARRPGERHGMAFQVHYCRSTLPGITALVPCPPPAALPLIAGRVNKAFRAAKLAQPETYGVRCLTQPASPGHIWEATVRLYDGVTLTDLRARQKPLAIALGVPWLRIVEHGNDCRIVAGVDPAAARLGERERAELAAYDWEQVWRDARCTGVDGALPALTDIRQLPSNPAVSELVFRIPSGLDVPRLKAAKQKIAAASQNGFVDVNVGVEPSTVRLLVARSDPMPLRAPYRFDFDPGPGRIAFADGIDGEPVIMDLSEIAHLLLTGTSGGGKTVAGQVLLMGALAHGAEVAVIDVQKGCADFRFAEPWTMCMTGDLADAAATMGALYAEVQRRRDLNAAHGVGSVQLLPEAVRPPDVFVFIDELFGLISSAEKPTTKPETNPDLEAERLETLATYNAKAKIAYLTGRIGAEARSAGFHLVLMTQGLTSKMKLPSSIADLKLNSNRVLLGKANHGDRTSALRQPESAPDPGDVVPQGRAVYEPVVGPAKLVQFWYDSTAAYTAWLDGNVERVSDDERLDIDGFRLDTSAGAAFVVTDEHSGANPDAQIIEADLGPAGADASGASTELDLFAGLDLPELVDDDTVDWSVVVGFDAAGEGGDDTATGDGLDDVSEWVLPKEERRPANGSEATRDGTHDTDDPDDEEDCQLETDSLVDDFGHPPTRGFVEPAVVAADDHEAFGVLAGPPAARRHHRAGIGALVESLPGPDAEASSPAPRTSPSMADPLAGMRRR